MKEERKPIRVVEESDATMFEDSCAALVQEEYRIISSSCGFVNSDKYDFCSSYQAIFTDIRLD